MAGAVVGRPAEGESRTGCRRISHPAPWSRWPRAQTETPLGLALAALGLILSSQSVLADAADLGVARDLYARGQYPQAREQLAAAARGGGRAAVEAELIRGRLELETGRLDETERAVRAVLGAAAARPDEKLNARVLRAQALIAQGRLAEARAELDTVFKRDPKHTVARATLGSLLAEMGERAQAERLFDTFYDDYKNRRLDETKAETLWALAHALRFNEDYEEANKQLGTAEKIDPGFYDAFIMRGSLFAEKYAIGYAEQEYQDVLKKNPNHPAALLGMARVKLEQSYDVPAALELAQKALAQNPRLVDAVLIRAEVAIDNEEWARAESEIQRALAMNPAHLRARSLLCTALYLKGDQAGYDRERRRVLAQNRFYSRVYFTVSEFAAKHHRYEEAIALNREAVKVNPKDHKARAALGINYLRMGDEVEGLKHLKESFDNGDQYNVRAYNTLNLFDDIFPKHYDVVQLGHFRMRLPRREKALLSRVAPRLLEKAYQEFTRRYHFTPQGPLFVELFGVEQHYAVRTVGLPGLGALGVCFGKVITARSPSSGRFNWEQVLWHELAHVYSIQLSKSRVPRWFTEGLAEVETMRARHEWERDNDQDLYFALRRGKLMKLADLNMGFVRARSMKDIVVAYYQSALVVDFLEKRFGFSKILEALKLFGEGKSTLEVIPRITSMSLEAFESAFRGELERRLLHMKGTYVPPEPPRPGKGAGTAKGLADLESRARAQPANAALLAELAMAYLAHGELEKARSAARRAIAANPAERGALYVEAEAAMGSRDFVTARRAYERLISLGADSYRIRLGAGLAADKLGDKRAAEQHLRRAKRYDPQKGEPAAKLAELLEQAGRHDEALAELEYVVNEDQMNLGAAKKLVERYSQKKRLDKVYQFAAKALAIDPFDVELHVALARGALGAKKPDEALFALENALALEPKRPAPIWISLAEVHLARGDRAKAKSALDKALAYEPQNVEARQLAARNRL